MSQYIGFTLAEIKNQIHFIGDAITLREREYVADAGINTNSMLAGFACGALSVTTAEEKTALYELKKELMARSGDVIREAKERNAARRAERNAKRKKAMSGEDVAILH